MEDEDIEKMLIQQKETLNQLENYIKQNKENREKEDKDKLNKDNENSDYLMLKQEFDKLFKEYKDLSQKYNEVEYEFKKYKSNAVDNSDITPKNKEQLTQKVNKEVNKEVTQKNKEELTQKVNKEVTPKNNEEVAPKNKEELTQKVNKEVAPKNNEEVTSKVNKEVAPKNNEEVILKVGKEIAPKNNEEVAPKVNKEVAPKNNQEVTPQVNKEVASKSNQEVAPKVSKEVSTKNNKELTQKNNQQTTSKVDKKVVPKNNPRENPKENPKNSFELKIGTKYTNIVGFIFIIISILLMAQYSYVNFAISDLAKTIMFYGSGIIVLVIAEILNNRRSNIFSIGLTAGGISILFVSTGVAYFYFNIISSLTGIILVVLTSSVAFLLSLKYDRQIISVFAIVGAYLPIIVLFDNSKIAISALVYFLVCNVFSSLLAFKKRWNVLSYFSVILNFLSISVVFVFIDTNKEIPFLFNMVYLIVTLLFYVVLSLINPVKNNLVLKTNELVLLFMSIAIGSGLCYSQLYAYDMEKYNGVFTIVLSVIFYCIGWKLKKVLANRKMSDLMYIMSLFFAILVAPMQLSSAYITMAWMVMAVVLLGYAVYSKSIEFMYAGTTFLILSMLSFLILDISILKMLFDNDDVLYRYTVFTVGCIISLYLYMKSEIEIEKEYILFRDSWLVSYFKVFNIFNVVFYAYYVYKTVLSDRFDFTVAISIFIITICAYVYYLLKTKLLTDKEKTIYVNIILWITYARTLFANFLVELDIHSSGILINIICVMLYNIVILYVANKTIKQTKLFNKKQEPIANIVLLSISLLSIMANTDVQLGALNTLIFGVIAFVCILQGLRTLDTALRRFGLGLMIVSICKFFMFDLSAQTALQKILSYFVFGVILICISYLYQKLLQKFEINSSDTDVNVKVNGKPVDSERTANESKANSHDTTSTSSKVTTIDKSEDLPKE